MDGIYDIAVTVDVEGCWYETPGEQNDFDLYKLQADLQILVEELDILSEQSGEHIPVSWFIRCDDSIAAKFGYHYGLLSALDTFIDRRRKLGDEFGVHPHLYQINNGTWSKQSHPDAQYEQIIRSASGWAEYFTTPPTLSRIGESTMSPAIARALSEVGICFDSTALPSRYRLDNDFNIDWRGTPLTPYFPSREDYRYPCADLDATWPFLEIPFTMLPIKTVYDRESLLRYFNLAFEPELVARALHQVALQTPLVTILHPHEITVGGAKGQLVSFERSSLRENITTLQASARELHFKRISEIGEKYVQV